MTIMLDNDLYKFTMQQAVCQRYPRAWAEYRLFFRDAVELPDNFADALKEDIRINLCGHKFEIGEIEFLKTKCPFLNPVYLDFLYHYRYNLDDPRIDFTLQKKGTELELVYRGPWYYTILWEVPLMSKISELYFRLSGAEPLPRKVNKRNNEDTAKALRGYAFADFGTRRRFSYRNHCRVLEDLLSVPDNSLVGTSNVHLAKTLGLRPIGTMAHEWIMFHGATSGYAQANAAALETWSQVYRGDLGVALTDTYTTESFLRTFGTYHAKLFDGVRQDSGDAFKFVTRVIRHYEDLGIDPRTKTIVFSDGLDPTMIKHLGDYCHNRIRCSFGIGTNLTNNVGVKPLNMVIKMTKAKLTEDHPWIPTVKLSDFKTKNMGDSNQINLCKQILNIKE